MIQLKFFYLALSCFLPAFVCDNLQTLKSISVTFRHGDRTPEAENIICYPNDPYRSDPMEPMGRGGLINKGKLREYQTGVKLRERYNTFLGSIYRSKDVSVISTGYDRTRMSLSLVLNALYPPRGKQVWKTGFDWQPIPIDTIPDFAVGLVDSNKCPAFLKELDLVKASEEYQKDVSVFKPLMKNLTVLSGHKIKDTNAIFDIYHTLTAEAAMNLKLPKWVEPYFPNEGIKAATLFQYKTYSYTTKLKKLNGGVQIRKILNHLIFDEEKNKTKVNLYSVHETTMAALLNALNLWKDNVPEYGSALIVELHKRDGNEYLKIVYYNSIPPTFETRTIPGCSEYCLVDDFLNILKDVIPDDAFEACFGPPNDSLLIPKNENSTEWIYQQIRDWYHI